MRANKQPVITYEYATQLVACSTPLLDATRREGPTPSMFLDVFEETRDIDPYSSVVLDEFGEQSDGPLQLTPDEVMFQDLSATTRSSSKPSGRSERRFNSSRYISSSSRQPISAWKHNSAL